MARSNASVAQLAAALRRCVREEPVPAEPRVEEEDAIADRISRA